MFSKSYVGTVGNSGGNLKVTNGWIVYLVKTFYLLGCVQPDRKEKQVKEVCSIRTPTAKFNNYMARLRLKEILEEYGVKQTDLRRIIKAKGLKPINHDRISRMYNGKLVNVSLETLDTLCKALNCSYDDLIEEE